MASLGAASFGHRDSESFDYTEGAEPIDIDAAIANNRRSRRDSQYSTPYGENGVGSMFDGPGHVVNPSSVSRMSHSLSRRRSGDGRRMSVESRRLSTDGRRMSMDSRRSGGTSVDGNEEEQYLSGEDVEESGTVRSRGRRRRRKSPSPIPAKSTVFENFAYIFGRTATPHAEPSSSRRPSLSARSLGGLSRRSRHAEGGSDYAVDTDSEEERWGYLSGEEDEGSEDEGDRRERASPSVSDMDYGSYPPSPAGSEHEHRLPMLSADPIFGNEARIDFDMDFEPLEPPPLGPPSRQTIYVADEDNTVRFIGYETQTTRQYLWRIGCILTCGILGLLGNWFPRLWLRWVSKERAFKDIADGFVVVETAYRDIALFPIHRMQYPYPISTAFPSTGFESSTPRTTSISSPKVNGGGNEHITTSQDTEDFMLDHLLVVDYRYARFALDPRSGLFTMLKDWRDPTWNGVLSVHGGLQQPVRQQRWTLFGPNVIDIEGKSTISLLIDEVIHPFYVFQIASIVLWSLDDYYYYAFCIALISAVSVTTTLIETRKTIARMREMSRFSCRVKVYVNGGWTERDSVDLVPGDIVDLVNSHLTLFPADLFLLSGDAIVNESMLTGESVPVSKTSIKDQDLVKWLDSQDVNGETAKSFLYAGTRVVRVRSALTADGSVGSPALGLVVRTGFNTTKGALVRSMLFPKPTGFKFYRDSIRFIVVLAGIAGLGFCASAVQFVRLGVPWHTILLRALDLVTVVVPPALPATLSIGTSFAISRLRKSGIFCIAPSRVNISGKVNVCCFDKTGTLTEDGLDILGVRGLERNVNRFGELIEDVHDLPMSDAKANFLYALATCHSLQVVDGEIIGDPLDVKMFTFTKWTLEEGHVAGTGKIKGKAGGETRPAALVQTVVRPPGSGQFRLEDALKGATKHAHFLEMGVIRTFEFVSSLRRMSVIVKRLKSNSMEVYVKGAPEVMIDICDKDSCTYSFSSVHLASVHIYYDDLLSYYTKRGYRVIAMAGKTIEGLSWLKAQRMKREQAESGLRFLGLIIFENKLKPGTTPVIQALRTAHLACRMITGDNPLTAVSVARECNLINQAAHVFSPVFIRGNASTRLAKLEWFCTDEPAWKLDDYSLKPLTPPAHRLVEAEEVDYQDCVLAVTGDIFRWMINYAPLETLQRMLVKTQIFARMSPDEKNEVVERLQALGYTVLMCGDGANDCAALKAADVGLSLSEAEASVAAPFTSSTPDISCVLEVIKEGRAALVTSFSCFKYMCAQNLVMLLLMLTILLTGHCILSYMGRTLPYSRIHTKRPTASLVSKKVLASIIGQIVITSAVQFWTFFWVRSQSWYTPPHQGSPKDGDSHLEATNYENSALFLVSCFQYILVAAVFSIGPPYRKPMWTNGWLMLAIIGLSSFNVLVLLRPPRSISAILELMSLPFSARITLLMAVVLNVAVSMAFEQWGTQFVAQAIGLVMQLFRGHQRIREGKLYKAVEGGMR
ncbi:hypothetical protein NEOLEDRAFT_1158964 [Neolentinus lepideus HHB14362 ss-1]|uniref:Cation-transporting ATPase n=1 Tax=Neolentinus lepideus HHB14362 ss-1 TaxID=1314782 RepID=A0A165NIH5_9AGAM|nr:hypothetical protein NEOLEDRAFT_1158964 [Neolentinus lepideus HHB14362 ss-1]